LIFGKEIDYILLGASERCSDRRVAPGNPQNRVEVAAGEGPLEKYVFAVGFLSPFSNVFHLVYQIFLVMHKIANPFQ